MVENNLKSYVESDAYFTTDGYILINSPENVKLYSHSIEKFILQFEISNHSLNQKNVM